MASAQEMLDFYMRAETSVLQGQSIRYGERLLTRAGLAEIRKGRKEWQSIVDGQTAGPRRPRFAVADFGDRTLRRIDVGGDCLDSVASGSGGSALAMARTPVSR